MRIEVLYFLGCPNHEPTMGTIEEVLSAENVTAEVHSIQICDVDEAREAKFIGSPSVRIDGLDIEPSSRTNERYGMMCRMYRQAGGLGGVPPRSLIEKAVRETSSENLESK
jgi:hypothetical protein